MSDKLIVDGHPELLKDSYSKGVISRDHNAYEKYMSAALSRRNRQSKLDDAVEEISTSYFSSGNESKLPKKDFFGNGEERIGMFDAGGHCTRGQTPPGGWVKRDCSGTCVGIHDDLGHEEVTIKPESSGDEGTEVHLASGPSKPPHPWDYKFSNSQNNNFGELEHYWGGDFGSYQGPDKCYGHLYDSGMPQGFGAGCRGKFSDLPDVGPGSCTQLGAFDTIFDLYAYPTRAAYNEDGAGVCFGGINHNMPCCDYTDCPGLPTWNPNQAVDPMPWLPAEVRKPGGNVRYHNTAVTPRADNPHSSVNSHSPYHEEPGTCDMCICGAEYNSVFEDFYGRDIDKDSHRCQPTFAWSVARDKNITAAAEDLDISATANGKDVNIVASGGGAQVISLNSAGTGTNDEELAVGQTVAFAMSTTTASGMGISGGMTMSQDYDADGGSTATGGQAVTFTTGGATIVVGDVEILGLP